MEINFNGFTFTEEVEADEWDIILKAKEYVSREIYTLKGIQLVLRRYKTLLSRYKISLAAFCEIQNHIGERVLQLCEAEFKRTSDSSMCEKIFEKYSVFVGTEQLPPELIGTICAMFYRNTLKPIQLQYRKDEK